MPAQTPESGLAQEVFEEANKARAQEGLPALVADPQLQEWAGEWAVRAARERSLAHRKDLPARMKAHGWAYLNENMYSGSGPMTAARIVRAWMNSAGHRRNLLHARITAAGFGIARNDRGETYAVFNGGVR